MAQTSAGSGPIPPAKKDDSEDVAWALSTAEAMYARGDRSDALKWLRRAAEAASEAQADDRALELAKAAADLASAIGPSTSAPPPPPPLQPPPAAPSRPSAPMRAQTPPPAPPSSPARPMEPRTGTPPRQPTTRAASPFAPAAARITEPRRAARRSRPEVVIARPPDEVTQQMEPDSIPAPHAPEPVGRRALEEITPPAPPVAPAPAPTPIQPFEVARSEVTPIPGEDMDAWPTQSLVGDELDPPDEKTRIGVPAYEASARLATEATGADDPALRPAQALRVVVWRAADGVHVAPQGTRVAAISIDAVLVALDPSADLAAWLSGK